MEMIHLFDLSALRFCSILEVQPTPCRIFVLLGLANQSSLPLLRIY